MKRPLVLLSIALATSATTAQSLSYESVRVADLIADAAWKPLENFLPVMTDGIERELKAKGSSEKVAKVMTDELRRNFTRESVAKSVAQALSEQFTVPELKELDEFLRSTVGQKYSGLSQTLGSDPKYMKPIVKQTCDSASKRLTSQELSSLVQICG